MKAILTLHVDESRVHTRDEMNTITHEFKRAVEEVADNLVDFFKPHIVVTLSYEDEDE